MDALRDRLGAVVDRRAQLHTGRKTGNDVNAPKNRRKYTTKPVKLPKVPEISKRLHLIPDTSRAFGFLLGRPATVWLRALTR